MGGPAASGALGPELPDLVVLEIGVDKVPQGRPLGAERARERRRGVCVTGGGGRDGLGRGHGRGSSLWWRPRVGGVRPHSLWWARQASGMCDGEGTAMWEDGGRVHMYGARIRPVRPPHRAARQDRARRARTTATAPTPARAAGGRAAR